MPIFDYVIMVTTPAAPEKVIAEIKGTAIVFDNLAEVMENAVREYGTWATYTVKLTTAVKRE